MKGKHTERKRETRIAKRGREETRGKTSGKWNKVQKQRRKQNKKTQETKADEGVPQGTGTRQRRHEIKDSEAHNKIRLSYKESFLPC